MNTVQREMNPLLNVNLKIKRTRNSVNYNTTDDYMITKILIRLSPRELEPRPMYK